MITLNKQLELALKNALAHLQNSDVIEACSCLEMAIRLPMDDDTRRLVRSANDEANIGSPTKAETYLNLALNPLPTVQAAPDFRALLQAVWDEQRAALTGSLKHEIAKALGITIYD